MAGKWGKFTAKGSSEIERTIEQMVQKLADAFAQELSSIQYTALVMIGGYGRGEGGVVTDAGGERPHNNFDFVLFTKKMNDKDNEQLKQKLVEAINPVVGEIEMAVDLSVLSTTKVQRSDCRIIWYDMRFGHKTILGDASFVPSLTHFSLERIPDWDARNLLVNRGTLMIINDLLLEKETLSNAHKKLIVKHMVKAIIGYGDTLLYFLNDYDWSYVAKQQRMRARPDVDPAFKEIYEEAMNFRFQPSYETYMARDLVAWTNELRGHFEKIALICESKRLYQSKLTWEKYPDVAFLYALFDDLFRLRSWAKKAFYFVKSRPYPGNGSLWNRVGFRSLGDSGVLPIFFPLFAYHLDNDYFRSMAMKFLGTNNATFDHLRSLYLQLWGKTGDTNFAQVLSHYDISLQHDGS